VSTHLRLILNLSTDWVETEAWQKWVNEYGKPYEGRQVPYSSSAGTTPLSYA
jgi:hypothetical protein